MKTRSRVDLNFYSERVDEASKKKGSTRWRQKQIESLRGKHTKTLWHWKWFSVVYRGKLPSMFDEKCLILAQREREIWRNKFSSRFIGWFKLVLVMIGRTGIDSNTFHCCFTDHSGAPCWAFKNQNFFPIQGSSFFFRFNNFSNFKRMNWNSSSVNVFTESSRQLLTCYRWYGKRGWKVFVSWAITFAKNRLFFLHSLSSATKWT